MDKTEVTVRRIVEDLGAYDQRRVAAGSARERGCCRVCRSAAVALEDAVRRASVEVFIDTGTVDVPERDERVVEDNGYTKITDAEQNSVVPVGIRMPVGRTRTRTAGRVELRPLVVRVVHDDVAPLKQGVEPCAQHPNAVVLTPTTLEVVNPHVLHEERATTDAATEGNASVGVRVPVVPGVLEAVNLETLEEEIEIVVEVKEAVLSATSRERHPVHPQRDTIMLNPLASAVCCRSANDDEVVAVGSPVSCVEADLSCLRHPSREVVVQLNDQVSVRIDEVISLVRLCGNQSGIVAARNAVCRRLCRVLTTGDDEPIGRWNLSDGVGAVGDSGGIERFGVRN